MSATLTSLLDQLERQVMAADEAVTIAGDWARNGRPQAANAVRDVIARLMAEAYETSQALLVVPDEANGPSPLTAFRVSFSQYGRYCAVIQAADETEARRLAATKLREGGPDAFDIIEHTRDDFDIEEAVS